MPPAITRRHRPGFLFYYDEGEPLRRRGRLSANVIRAVTVCAVLALIHLIGLTLGPVIHS
ncbi:hypothetical protein [Actinomadura rugatobispora]|uniref:Uncharacterized protein n=1 Tax=Actinomadura rugatobispora TaxID=1994 RepID=A0ABW0ZYI5_9ACTN|nr:hypothetical protein GCM10010200_055840 [Actinomadura rugatobispora]